jgi:hypothetical protein
VAALKLQLMKLMVLPEPKCDNNPRKEEFCSFVDFDTPHKLLVLAVDNHMHRHDPSNEEVIFEVSQPHVSLPYCPACHQSELP